jgi:hypothetical protein
VIEAYGFKQQMAMSYGVIESMDVPCLLMSKIPGSTGVRKADTADDKQGTDYFVDHIRGVPLSVDVKAREIDPIDTYQSDDLALETWSVMRTKRGWTWDAEKRTDYILWLFAPTKRYCLIPFHPLQVAFLKHAREWCKTYKRVTQPNIGYRSECVFVPRNVVWRAIYEVSNGNVVEP